VNTSPTPETEAAIAQIVEGADADVAQAFNELVDFALKLKRERDESRLNAESIVADFMTVKDERDQLRDACDLLMDTMKFPSYTRTNEAVSAYSALPHVIEMNQRK
jgi:hypothetical protein